MYIIKNAWLSITRNKSRNILISIIILIIAAAATVALAINNTASDLIASYQSAYDKEATITFDRESTMKDFDFSNRDNITEMSDKFSSIASYTISDIENFATSEHVEDYYYTFSTSLNGSNIEPATTTTETNSPSDMPGGFGGGDMGQNPNPQASSLDFTITGYSSLTSMSEFIDGTYTITEIADDAWTKAFDGNYAFVNSELASYNNLSLGSEITLIDESNNTFSFTIIGIYEEANSSDSPSMNIFADSANTIITNTNAVATILESNSDLSSTLTPTFIIDDYANLDAIQSEFYSKGLDETYILESNEEVATSGLDSVKNVQSFATTFLVVTLIIGGVVLFVINMINIRERKYEIGVLRTIGMSKLKLSAQFVSELLIVSLAALIVGAGIGAIASKNVSNSLLASEISSSTSKTDDIKANFGGSPNGTPGQNSNESSAEEIAETQGQSQSQNMPELDNIKTGGPSISAYDSIDAVVNFTVILELLGIGLGLVLISSLASMISIQRFSPLTILKERS